MQRCSLDLPNLAGIQNSFLLNTSTKFWESSKSCGIPVGEILLWKCKNVMEIMVAYMVFFSSGVHIMLENKTNIF